MCILPNEDWVSGLVFLCEQGLTSALTWTQSLFFHLSRSILGGWNDCEASGFVLASGLLILSARCASCQMRIGFGICIFVGVCPDICLDHCVIPPGRNILVPSRLNRNRNTKFGPSIFRTGQLNVGYLPIRRKMVRRRHHPPVAGPVRGTGFEPGGRGGPAESRGRPGAWRQGRVG